MTIGKCDFVNYLTIDLTIDILSRLCLLALVPKLVQGQLQATCMCPLPFGFWPSFTDALHSVGGAVVHEPMPLVHCIILHLESR